MKWIRRAAVCLAVLSACMVVWCVVAFSRPHVRELRGATYNEFVAQAGEDFGLPPSARDIHFVISSVGLAGRARVVKFTAPVEDCRSYAVADSRALDGSRGATTPSFAPIVGRPAIPGPLEIYGIRDLRWFDIEGIQEGLTVERGQSQRHFTWIDTRRGILYSLWTD